MPTPQGKRARVTFDFESRQPDELPLSVGEEITVLNQDDAGWWTGAKVDAQGQQRQGLFPGNYVEIL